MLSPNPTLATTPRINTSPNPALRACDRACDLACDHACDRACECAIVRAIVCACGCVSWLRSGSVWRGDGQHGVPGRAGRGGAVACVHEHACAWAHMRLCLDSVHTQLQACCAHAYAHVIRRRRVAQLCFWPTTTTSYGRTLLLTAATATTDRPQLTVTERSTTDHGRPQHWLWTTVPLLVAPTCA